jgi:hypothetical protein
MKRAALSVPLGTPDAEGRQAVAIVSRRSGPRFLLARLAREIEAADAEDRRQIEAVLDTDLDRLPEARLEAMLGSLTGTQAALLLKMATAGRRALLGATQTRQARRARGLRGWIEATAPAARNVRELRAHPDFPPAAALLSDETVRAAARDAGLVFSAGRPKRS